MKKLLGIALILMLCFSVVFAGGKKDGPKTVKIGIAKIVQHAALDAVEQGVIDAVEAAGFKAVFDCQNANGDVNTANQIAAQFKDEGVDVAVGIATPVAIALANTMKNVPIVFGAVTDPVGAGLVKTVAHGDGNITGMSDELPSKEEFINFRVEPILTYNALPIPFLKLSHTNLLTLTLVFFLKIHLLIHIRWMM